MKEGMRCHPGVSFPLERVVPAGGVDLCGVHLAPGTIVGINPAVIHQEKSIFGEDAAHFRPERWTECDSEHAKYMDRYNLTVSMAFLIVCALFVNRLWEQFGYGSRTCIGKNISIMEMGKLIPQLMRHFDFEWASSKPEWRVETYWFARQHDMICRLKSRSKGSNVS
jgi:cytochrome P450